MIKFNIGKLRPTFIAIFSVSMVANAQQVPTDPVGFVNSTIAGSTSAGVAKITPFSPVMLEVPSVTGVSAGTIANVTSNTISVSAAGWTADSLPAGQTYLQITSGTQEGLILRIISNSGDSATVDTLGLNIAAAGVSAGNNFKLIVGETLLSMFGTGSGTPTENVVLGGSSSQLASRSIDFVVALDTTRVLRTYYFDTAANQWRRPGSSSDQGNIPIPPFAGVVYYRLASTPITLSQTGTVPTKPVRFIVPASGSVFLGRFFPQDGTLSAYNLTDLEGWNNTSQPGVTTTSVDKLVTTDETGTLRTFYHNGTAWVRTGSGTSRNSTPVPATGAGYTIRLGSGEPKILTVPLPYAL